MSSHVKSHALPGYARDLLAACPGSGGGVHQWLFRCARVLHRFLPEPEIGLLLEAASAGCGRALEPHEIPDAIRNSKAYASDSKGTSAKSSAKPLHHWPDPNIEQIEAVVRNGVHLVDLWERSPIRLEGYSHTEELIDRLFPGNPFLCCGRTSKYFGTGTREEWRGQLSALSFIVPSPMTAEEGRRKSDGQLSPRTLENTGPRKYLVIECDFSVTARDGKTATKMAPLIRSLEADGITVADMCSAILWQLAKHAPLAMVVHSAGKSLHGWYPCEGQPEELLHKFMRLAVSLGADPATWTRCQFVRMPDGLRRNGNGFPLRQSVYYFNPEELQ